MLWRELIWSRYTTVIKMTVDDFILILIWYSCCILISVYACCFLYGYAYRETATKEGKWKTSCHLKKKKSSSAQTLHCERIWQKIQRIIRLKININQFINFSHLLFFIAVLKKQRGWNVANATNWHVRWCLRHKMKNLNRRNCFRRQFG